VPSNLHLVTRDDDQRGTDHSAGDWDQGASPSDFPPGWDDYAAARRRFLRRVAKRRADRDEAEPLEDGEEESWL
jgi:hypothetical protein